MTSHFVSHHIYLRHSTYVVILQFIPRIDINMCFSEKVSKATSPALYFDLIKRTRNTDEYTRISPSSGSKFPLDSRYLNVKAFKEALACKIYKKERLDVKRMAVYFRDGDEYTYLPDTALLKDIQMGVYGPTCKSRRLCVIYYEGPSTINKLSNKVYKG